MRGYVWIGRFGSCRGTDCVWNCRFLLALLCLFRPSSFVSSFRFLPWLFLSRCSCVVLCVACCVLSTVCFLLYAVRVLCVCCVLSPACCVLRVVYCLFCVVYCLLSHVCCPLPVVCCVRAVCCVWRVACCLLSVVRCLLSVTRVSCSLCVGVLPVVCTASCVVCRVLRCVLMVSLQGGYDKTEQDSGRRAFRWRSRPSHGERPPHSSLTLRVCLLRAHASFLPAVIRR